MGPRRDGFHFRAEVMRGRTSLIALLVLGCLSGCGRKADTGARLANIPQGTVPGAAPGAAPGIHLISELAGAEWRMAAGDYGNLRYSPLDTIKTTNVKDLHVVTTMST